MRIVSCLILLFVAADVTRARPEGDSLTKLGPGRYRLDSFARIEHEKVDECSGIAFQGGAWFTHNDSGGDPENGESSQENPPTRSHYFATYATVPSWSGIGEAPNDQAQGAGRRRRPFARTENVRIVARYGRAPARPPSGWASGRAAGGPSHCSAWLGDWSDCGLMSALRADRGGATRICAGWAATEAHTHCTTSCIVDANQDYG